MFRYRGREHAVTAHRIRLVTPKTDPILIRPISLLRRAKSTPTSHPHSESPDSPRNIIRMELAPPLFTTLPHHPRPLDIKLPRPQKPQQVLVREPVVPGPRVDPFVRRVRRNQVLGFQNGAKLGEGLLLRCVAMGTRG